MSDIKAVFKYPLLDLNLGSEVTIPVPIGGKILHVAIQSGVFCLWIRVDNNNKRCNRTFILRATGQAIHDNWVHLATAEQLSFIWHVFEIEEA